MNDRILAIFEQHADEFVSGEQLSEMLQCSRTAIWKHIQALKEAGYEFEAVSRRGYRLLRQPDRWSAVKLLAALKTRTMGRRLKLLDEVDSTQTVAHQLALEGADEGTLVVAEQQLAGRGRMGKAWHSPKGKGIWMSLVLRPTIPMHFTPQLTLLTAVAVCRAIRKLAGVPAAIKWPNDILIEGRKVCGILLESVAEDERLRYVIAGIGISVNLEQDDYPDELRPIATSLRLAAGREIDRIALLTLVLEEFEALYTLYHEHGFEPIRTSWEALTMSLGGQVRANTAKGTITGTALAIDEMGALIVETEAGDTIKLYSAEIQHA
ncbi:biotin--[acetyl-CoA-carboxylase] ligase [Paenibacillus sp. HJGM_3]|uniref:biotin--[acetyl-CoA-carboxylase] ligase n=1 Tax=Paenibacillus sp. HJGM_3 TaxID=3379816 RepID=UPI00385B9CF0